MTVEDWQKILILPTATMAETIEVIDKGAMQLALVVDEHRQLLGVVTDGDIRRALIRHVPMDSAIVDVMHKSPVVAKRGTSKSQLLNMMNRKMLSAIPLVENNIVVGLETLQKIVERSHYDNPVFLMAGGFGTRLKPLTDNCPKPLLKLGGKPILETILENFIAAGFHRFYISTHYMPEMIEAYFGDGDKWGVTIEYVYEDSPLGTGGALGLLPDDLPDLPLIMMNGDLLTKVDFAHLLDYHLQQTSIATMCVTEYEYQVPYGVIESSGNKITHMVEKPLQRHFVNAGIYVVNPELIKRVAKNQAIDMPTLLEQQIADDEDVTIFPIHEYWLDIGKMPDFDRAKVDIKTQF